MNSSFQNFQVIIKSIIDYFVSVLCLVLLSPLILALTIVIKISGKGPVVHSQKRIGKYGKSFTMYKFRSMYFDTEEDVPLLSGKNDKRITPVGRFMRKHKFDEIPNFINVLKGEMSLVGPRPEQQFFIDQILLKTPKYKLLQTIKPGITSWGQVKYGYASTVDEMVERLEYDLFYLENKSLWFDLKIMFYTIGIIFKGGGI
jgi:lipopolysaccharide/colanic/teichoic acid biosynthesis glycosyltransferase